MIHALGFVANGLGAMDLFDVYVAGFEVSEERAVRGLVQVFGMSKPAAQNFVRSLPRMGKRKQSADAAERYVRTLRAIGAVVQCNVSRPTSLPPPDTHVDQGPHHVTSLPVPMRSTMPSAGPSSAEIAASMPSIPRTPRLPDDFQLLPPSDSTEDLPEWFMTDPTQANRKTTASVPAPSTSRPPRDHDRHYAISIGGEPAAATPAIDDRVARGSSKNWGPRADHVAKIGAHLSVSPSGIPVRIPSAPAPAPRSWLGVLVIVAIGAAVALGYAYRHGVFETEAARAARAFESEGLEMGDYREALGFLETPGARFDGIELSKLRDLLDALHRTGAAHVWAIGIEVHGDMKTSSSLVIELPDDANARRTIFFQHARQIASHRVATDHGQRFLQLDF